MKRAKKKKSNKTKVIPKKIHEIISYLAHTFSKNNLFEEEDLKQDLYLLYFETLKTLKQSQTNKPGWWFIRFKWYLLTKYRREVSRINREWRFVLEKYNIRLPEFNHLRKGYKIWSIGVILIIAFLLLIMLCY